MSATWQKNNYKKDCPYSRLLRITVPFQTGENKYKTNSNKRSEHTVPIKSTNLLNHTTVIVSFPLMLKASVVWVKV